MYKNINRIEQCQQNKAKHNKTVYIMCYYVEMNRINKKWYRDK